MSLPPRQQVLLDQIEQVLQSTDPRLRSMFAAFHRSAPALADEHTETTAASTKTRRTVLVCLMVAAMLGGLVLGIRATSNDCPGLSSDQVVASATVRYAACSKSTDVWSRGAR